MKASDFFEHVSDDFAFLAGLLRHVRRSMILNDMMEESSEITERLVEIEKRYSGLAAWEKRYSGHTKDEETGHG